jgi:hypothetical protein
VAFTTISNAAENDQPEGSGAGKVVNGQVILTDTCVDSQLPPHDGFQVGNRCVSTEFGEVGVAANNPTLLITDAPENIAVNTPFTLKVSTRNLIRDRFLAAGKGGYYVESSVLQDGIVRGHFHTACRMLTSTDEAPDPAPVPAFFVATEDSKGSATPDEVSISVPGLPAAGIAQCASWAGDGSHRIPMMERANQTPALDAVRITVGDAGNGGDDGDDNGGGTGNGDTGDNGQTGDNGNTGGDNGGNTGGDNGDGNTGGDTGDNGGSTGGDTGDNGGNTGAGNGGNTGGGNTGATKPPTKTPTQGGTKPTQPTTKDDFTPDPTKKPTKATNPTPKSSTRAATTGSNDNDATSDNSGDNGDGNTAGNEESTTEPTKKATPKPSKSSEAADITYSNEDGQFNSGNKAPINEQVDAAQAANNGKKDSGALALTGQNTLAFAGGAVVLVLGGLLLMVFTKRRRPGGTSWE